MHDPTRRLCHAAHPVVALLAALFLAAVVAAGGCGSGAEGDAGRPRIVVTTTVLGSVVEGLVGDAAEVVVLMPNGADPHDFQPSARDAATLGDADLVVENGLGLEEGLRDAISAARDGGVRVFSATDHVRLRKLGKADEHGSEDPHIWMDPIAMRDVVEALAVILRRDLGLDLTKRASGLTRRLEALDAEIRQTLSAIPSDRRRLVTGHESMGYFADRYRFTLVGALIPSSSSQAQVSAANLADVRALVEREGVPAIFDEAGTPAGVADAIGDQTGAEVVEIASHRLPGDGSYLTFMRDVAAAVRDGLAARS